MYLAREDMKVVSDLSCVRKYCRWAATWPRWVSNSKRLNKDDYTDTGMTVGARTILDQPTLRAFEEASADERYRGKDARVVYKWLNESERK